MSKLVKRQLSPFQDRYRDGVLNNIFESVCIAIEYVIKQKAESFLPDTTYASLDMDSLDYIELAMLLEEDFKIKIDDSVVSSFKTIDETVRYIQTQKVGQHD